jgi:hypothetical protein
VFFDRLKIIPSKNFGGNNFQPVKEVSPSYELFDIMGKKEDRRGEEWNSGNWITGETW